MNEDRLLRAAAAGAAEALRSSPQLLMRPGSVLDVDDTVSPAVVTVTVDGDSSAQVYGHALGGVPRVGSRCVVAFAPPQAVFVIDVERPWDVAWGMLGYTSVSDGTTAAIGTTRTAIAAVTVDLVAGRLYLVSTTINFYSPGGAANFGIELEVDRPSAAAAIINTGEFAPSVTYGRSASLPDLPYAAIESGSHIFTAYATFTTGGGTILYDGNRRRILSVRDEGPA